MINGHDDLSLIKGAGPKTRGYLSEIGINTVEELVNFFPKAYKDRGIQRSVKDARDGEKILARAVLCQKGRTYYYNHIKKTVLTFTQDGTNFKAVFYNQPYRTNMTVGKEFILYGAVSIENGAVILISPQTEPAGKSEYLTEGIYSVYPIPYKSNVNQRTVVKLLRSAFEVFSPEEILPFWILNAFDLVSREKSLFMLHFPHSEYEMKLGPKYALVCRFLAFAACRTYRKNMLRPKRAEIIVPKKTDEFIRQLGFTLTDDQQKALDDVYGDFKSSFQMNRLIQGDVGSGKTAVAMLSAFAVSQSGLQSAICAPTEILAKQHCQKYKRIFENFGVECAILYSSMNKKERRDNLSKIKAGDAKVIFGTHALFSEDVGYKNLTFIVVDEQQRYGVAQRALLEQKGGSPHVLVMSATPIPRTLMLSIYKDLDLSVIRNMPKGRKKIKSFVVGSESEDRLYRFVRTTAEEGGKTYIVCPAIDDEDLENVEGVYRDAAQKLAGLKVLKLTGAMKETEKTKVMNEFAYGDCKVLVATSVIEVGIDVPDATLIWIKGSDRFGLSQLHQLRGRVGRADKQSYCVFQSDNNSEKTAERLKVLESENDGFNVAKEDLRLRGAGEMFGFKQSGTDNTLIDDIVSNEKLFVEVNKAAEKLFASQKQEDREFLDYLLKDEADKLDQIVLN